VKPFQPVFFPHSVLCRLASPSESQFERNLQLPRRVCRGSNDTEVWTVNDFAWRRENDAVQSVECFNPKLKLHLIADWKSPEERKVDISEPVRPQ
jgi:hypothetical protein